MRRLLVNVLTVIFLGGILQLNAQQIQNNPGSNHGNRFEQLGTILPTPNEYRTASGTPGPRYWQQRCDYDITCTLNEEKRQLTGTELVTYYNQSPHTLTYLWLQLDENQHSNINNANYQVSNPMPKELNVTSLESYKKSGKDNGYGHKINSLSDINGNPLKYTINKTMMRVELPAPLQPGQKCAFRLSWSYNIVDRMAKGGRGGYEYFPEDDNCLFTMTQWYPRLCVYSDAAGWQNHQFTGRAEFALTFGNFKVQMTVPSDHIVGATGQCQNYAQTLSPAQFNRWKQAQTAKDVIEIVTLEEAKKAEQQKSKAQKTWVFKADSVRDFAWGSSRKFVMDAMPVNVEGKKTMCMSYYGKEAYPLYRRYSTKVIAHTIKTYSHFTIPYPYPVAQSVEAANGMEYPMICFNFGRTEKDGTYSESVKNGMLGVVIHEVGHNFFPMIVNSDERQWSWMDEGMNTFLQSITEYLFDPEFPMRRGPAWSAVDYMKLPKNQLEPIMSNSDNIVDFGANAYTKPAAGLTILRETIMGRELFDYAFKEYARRWAFKHPEPADFFRTMEDASGEDLDWFWRGWFYGTDPCDISLDSVRHFVADTSSIPKQEITTQIKSMDKPIRSAYATDVTKDYNLADKNIQYAVDADTSLRDFYWYYSRGLKPYSNKEIKIVKEAGAGPIEEAERQQVASMHFYELTFRNKGGLVMPLIIQWNFKDGSKAIDRIPAQVWRLNEKEVIKTFMKDKEVASIVLDPYRETADIDESNNVWNTPPPPSRFSLFKEKKTSARGQSNGPNPMQNN